MIRAASRSFPRPLSVASELRQVISKEFEKESKKNNYKRYDTYASPPDGYRLSMVTGTPKRYRGGGEGGQRRGSSYMSTAG